MTTAELITAVPRALDSYSDATGDSLVRVLTARAALEPFNVVATAIFALAIIHTFVAPRFAAAAHAVQQRHDLRMRAHTNEPTPSVVAEMLHFLGEIEVVFGIWAVVLMTAMTAYAGWDVARHYLNDSVIYTEAMFVVVIMTLASTRPIITFAEAGLGFVARTGGATPAAWWLAILIIGPILGSFITEPAAMTICALLLGRQFFDLQPSTKLKYATLGALFVNVSIGGTLTHFAAPPILMVARPWNWGTWFLMSQIGWKAILAIMLSTALYFFWFREELQSLAARPSVPDLESPEDDAPEQALVPVPAWVVGTHLAFVAWTVVNAHYPALFVGGFLFFLGFVKATANYQSRLELKTPLLVGFFLAGLVIHGGLQGWWIAPVLGRLADRPLFVSSMLLTAFNDNALITYLATLVPNLGDHLKLAVVEGAVVGGGLTVIANAPNPAGQALLNRFFNGAISPFGLVLGALPPTVIAALVFRLTG